MIHSIHFLSQRQAEKIVGRPDLILVSIRTRHSAPRLHGAFGGMLPLCFDDYDPDQDGPDSAQDTFSPEQAEELKQWLVPYLRSEEVFTLLVHCHAGVSRSAAVAWWAHQSHGIPLATTFTAGYLNRHVLRTLDPKLVPPPLPPQAPRLIHRWDQERDDLPEPAQRLLVVFAHGQKSGPWNSKIRHLAHIARSLGAEVMSPDYSDLDDPDARLERLLAMELPPHDQLVLAGSSMGAYVATRASQHFKTTGLFIMAPAFYLPGYAEQQPTSDTKHICLVHGWQDEVIPAESAIRFARQCQADLHLIPGDHLLYTAVPRLGRLFSEFLHQIMTEELAAP